MLSDEAVNEYDKTYPMNPVAIEEIKAYYADNAQDISFWPVNDKCEAFLDIIWAVTHDMCNGNEIQVVIDSNDNLYCSEGNPGLVWFNQDDKSIFGMKLPIKVWIHTHPFGRAFFSGTDWRTINTWRPMMERAIVVGDNEYYSYNLKSSTSKFVKYKFADVGPQRVRPNLYDFGGEEE